MLFKFVRNFAVLAAAISMAVSAVPATGVQIDARVCFASDA